MKQLPFSLVQKSNDTIGYIDIEGVIGESFWEAGVTKEQIKEDLERIKNSGANKIVVRVNSLGGDVNHALSIYDLISNLDIPTVSVINGFTASAGTIVALATDQVEMSENAFFLVHKPWTLTVGNANQMQNDMDFLNKLEGTINNIYQKRVAENDVKTLMEYAEGNGKWLNAQETLDYGFVDSILVAKKDKEPVYDLAKASEMGLPSVPGLPQNSPEAKSFIEKVKEKIFGSKDETEPTEEVIEEPAQIVDDNIVVEEEKPVEEVENVEEVEEVIEDATYPSIYAEIEDDRKEIIERLTNLEKIVNDLTANYNQVLSEKEALIVEKETLVQEKEAVLENVADLENKVKELEDEPLTLPLNTAPTAIIVEEDMATKRIKAWENRANAEKSISFKK